ncbi:ABC-2 family transporter protein [Ruminococcaceae bacterium YRB3002]|nr:ABC-2 family transporter protein [Ruminococcaceae bacterium YRB3002]
MVFAINLFPKLLSYLTTGSLGSQRVIIVEAPDSFKEFDGKMDDLYSYTFTTYDELLSIEGINDYDLVKNGDLLVEFYCGEDRTFEQAIKEKFDALYLTGEGEDVESNATIYVTYNEEKFTSAAKAEQFSNDVLGAYVGYIEDLAYSEYEHKEYKSFTVDDFNPITLILNNRSGANTQAARVIPGIMTILMFYCVYSLTCDMIAMEKNRGFLNKLAMTPVSPSHILWGKALSINILVTGSSLVTFLFLFLSSWINRSNDAGSLLPFGLFLMPDQLLYMVLAIPASVLVMTWLCFIVALELDRFEDTVANLQMILLLIVIGFFIQMFQYWDPIGLEYVIPVHNMIVLIRDAILSDSSISSFILVLAVNLVTAHLLMKRCITKMPGYIRQPVKGNKGSKNTNSSKSINRSSK